MVDRFFIRGRDGKALELKLGGDTEVLDALEGRVATLEETRVRIVDITEAEYNVLTDEEKSASNTIYRITDAESESEDTGPSIHVYDTVAEMNTSLQNGLLHEGDIVFTLDLEAT